MAFITIGETVQFRFKNDGDVYSGVVKNYRYNNDTYKTKRRVYLKDVKNVATGKPHKLPYWDKDVCVNVDTILNDPQMGI